MFPPVSPEMIKFINQNKTKASSQSSSIPTFDEYYEKRYLEECKYFVENPSFSISNMIFVSKLRENVRRMALDEYKKKYPFSNFLFSLKNNRNETVNNEDAKSEIGDGFEEISFNETNVTEEVFKPRRSARLSKK